MIHIVEIDPAATHGLRRAVLRNGDPHADVEWSGDSDDTTVHVGAIDEAGSVLAVSTWLRRPCPLHPDEPAVQLRGMATDLAHRGTGLGSLLLVDGMARSFAVRDLPPSRGSSGVELVWANVRVEALRFYERHDWTAVGPVFQIAETGLPHRVATCRSSAARR